MKSGSNGELRYRRCSSIFVTDAMSASALLPAHARAEVKIALLIGNEAYGSEIGRLANPHNEVALLESRLKKIGFDVVVARDAGLSALTRAVNDYARRIKAAGPGAIAFFYYSGLREVSRVSWLTDGWRDFGGQTDQVRLP